MEFDPEKLIKPRPFLILAELFLLPAAVLASKSYNASIACLGASTVLYYVGMTELVRKRLGRWAVKRFTVATSSGPSHGFSCSHRPSIHTQRL
ncbi:hypothetical protein [Thermococcus indicus]|uniref:hypothetical protein n=1 Tax=Thermococcus indicus TaxID=2586643 RepID=UPI001F0D7F53|nr:hypothetical protein [Thermococcus indicus]